MDKQSPVILIPAYQPDQCLIQLIQSILAINANCFFIVIDDGSNAEAKRNVFT